MKIAVYPGSFDPVTLGHLNIMERAAKLYDKVIVCVMQNSAKKCLFTPDERVEMIRSAAEHISNVEVDCCIGLLAEYVNNVGACAVVKGLRSQTDFEQEYAMAVINRGLVRRAETVFLPALPSLMHVSSTVAKELARYDSDLTGYLPEAIIPELKARMKDF